MPDGLDIGQLFEMFAKDIQARYEASTLTKHNGTKGMAREEIVKQLLRDNLPGIYSISNGEIFDISGAISNQNDVVISDITKPIFRNSETKFLPVDSVFGVCEVKTRLKKSEIEDVFKKCQTLKKMKLTKPDMHFGNFHESVSSVVFCFEDYDPQTLWSTVHQVITEKNIPKEEQVDVICVLDKYVYISNPKKFGWQYKSEDGKDLIGNGPMILPSEKETLLWFLVALQLTFNHTLPNYFDFLKYIRKTPKVMHEVQPPPTLETS